MKPSLKKVTKHENKFANLQKKAAEYNFRQNLKVVKKSEFTIKDEDKTGVSFILTKMRHFGTFLTTVNSSYVDISVSRGAIKTTRASWHCLMW